MSVVLLTGCATGGGFKPASATIKPAGAPAAPVTLTDFKLAGNLSGGLADFTLTATAHVEEAKGGTLDLLSGPVALTDIDTNRNQQMRADQVVSTWNLTGAGCFRCGCGSARRCGRRTTGTRWIFRWRPACCSRWCCKDWRRKRSSSFPAAARPERKGSEFRQLSAGQRRGASFPGRKRAPETEGKLFFSAEMWSQINVLPGLMRQTAVLNFKVMQGELNRVTLLLHGEGEVTRVQGDQVLAWSRRSRCLIRPTAGWSSSLISRRRTSSPSWCRRRRRWGFFRRRRTCCNCGRRTPRGLRGYFRIVNEGAVRLEVAQASGASQISPDQFPESDATRAIFRGGGQPAVCLSFCRGGFCAADPGGPDSAGTGGLGAAGLSPRRKRTGD